MDNIYVGCKRCEYKQVDVMSIREETVEYEDKEISTTIITYICPNCGWIEDDEHYLYKKVEGEIKMKIIYILLIWFTLLAFELIFIKGANKNGNNN